MRFVGSLWIPHFSIAWFNYWTSFDLACDVEVLRIELRQSRYPAIRYGGNIMDPSRMRFVGTAVYDTECIWWSRYMTGAFPIVAHFGRDWPCDLEIWLRGHSRSVKLVSFESMGAVSYSPSIVKWPFVTYLASKNGVTLKTRLGFVQGRWKWHHLIDRTWVPIRLP